MSPLARRLSGSRAALRAISATHVAVYRLSGGRLGASFNGMTFLLLRTTGARSGRLRTTPLLYIADGDALVLVASNGGQARHPDWLFNLRQTPEVELVVGTDAWRARARIAGPTERARLWLRVNEVYPYQAYQDAATSREIAVVVLDRL
jgi:deazaflavin-dependent oxidoreductase (nitroreductase family)